MLALEVRLERAASHASGVAGDVVVRTREATTLRAQLEAAKDLLQQRCVPPLFIFPASFTTVAALPSASVHEYRQAGCDGCWQHVFQTLTANSSGWSILPPPSTFQNGVNNTKLVCEFQRGLPGPIGDESVCVCVCSCALSSSADACTCCRPVICSLGTPSRLAAVVLVTGPVPTTTAHPKPHHEPPKTHVNPRPTPLLSSPGPILVQRGSAGHDGGRSAGCAGW